MKEKDWGIYLFALTLRVAAIEETIIEGTIIEGFTVLQLLLFLEKRNPFREISLNVPV